MQTAMESIVDYNRGRDPERLTLKFAALRSNAFAFFRGTCPLFYSALKLDEALMSSPLVLACGDLHLENFGSYKGDNRLVYFDINDFDESCIAPVAYELVRFLTSILVAAKPLKIDRVVASTMVTTFLDSYARCIMSTKPRWVERSVATGPVKALLQGLKSRHRCDLINQRTMKKAGKTRLIIDSVKTLPTTAKDRSRAESILTAYASTQPHPAFFEPIDIARRIAGNGSLGLERYVVLVRGERNKLDDNRGNYLIDIKVGNPSALATNISILQPNWESESARAISIQRIVQAISPALLGSIGVGERSYVIKELQPTADRVNLAKLAGKPRALMEVLRTMAEVTAWGHLRSCGRFGADSVDALADFAKGTKWRRQITDNATAAKALVSKQWKSFSADYDADLKRRLHN